ncbi:MAG: arsenic transporter [Deltaproteobacteria bacterium]|nr:arsenic transporter [Deltaproteobacteria bacterium]
MSAGSNQQPSMTLEALFTRRLLIVTGKGGTGKTVLSAALARLAAKRGKRVVACEVGRDPGVPCPLLGLLAPERRATLEPQDLGGGVSHALLRGEDGVREFLGEALPFRFMADRALKVDAVRRFIDAAPAFSEMGLLYRGMRLLDAKRRDGKPVHDVMILDAPASGHTLAFAALPDTIVKVFTAGPIAKAAKAGIAMLRDTSVTTSVVATLPEALPVSEALELEAGLRARSLHVGAIVANQVPRDPFSLHEREALERALPHEVLGRRELARISRAAVALERLDALAVPVLRVNTSTARGRALVDEACLNLDEALA